MHGLSTVACTRNPAGTDSRLVAVAWIGVRNEWRTDQANRSLIAEGDCRLGRLWLGSLRPIDNHRDESADQSHRRQQDHIAVLFPHSHEKQNCGTGGRFLRPMSGLRLAAPISRPSLHRLDLGPSNVCSRFSVSTIKLTTASRSCSQRIRARAFSAFCLREPVSIQCGEGFRSKALQPYIDCPSLRR